MTRSSLKRSFDPCCIRKATKHDCKLIAEIYNLHVDVGGATFDTSHLDEQVFVKQVSQRKPAGWFVALRDDQIVGWASTRQYSERFGYRFSCETAIYLLPTVLGSGIAGALQDRIDGHCIECNVHHAVARIVANNKRSLAFHYRHGYELVGIQKEVGRIDNSWVDVAILQKIYTSALSHDDDDNGLND